MNEYGGIGPCAAVGGPPALGREATLEGLVPFFVSCGISSSTIQ